MWRSSWNCKQPGCGFSVMETLTRESGWKLMTTNNTIKPKILEFLSLALRQLTEWHVKYGYCIMREMTEHHSTMLPVYSVFMVARLPDRSRTCFSRSHTVFLINAMSASSSFNTGILDKLAAQKHGMSIMLCSSAMVQIFIISSRLDLFLLLPIRLRANCWIDSALTEIDCSNNCNQ